MSWDFPEKLKSLRESNDYNQDELAKIIGKTRGAFSNYERGLAMPTLKDLVLICEILNVTPNDLLLPDSEISEVKENGILYRRVNSNVQRYPQSDIITDLSDFELEHWSILPERTPNGQIWTVFRLESPAMEPRIPAGSYLCCEKASSFRDDYIYMCQFADNSLKCAALRRIRRRDSEFYNAIEMLSYSELHRPQMISESEIVNIWRVVRVLSERVF